MHEGVEVKLARHPETAETVTYVLPLRNDGRATIPVDKYAAWRSWVQQVDSLMHKEVRLVEAK